MGSSTLCLSGLVLLPFNILPPQGGPYVDTYLMWPTSADAAAAVDAAVNLTVSSSCLQSQPQSHSQAPHNTGSPAPGPGLKPGRGLPPPRLRGLGRREWRLCFSDVRVRLSGRRRAYVEGLKLVVPDNAEALLTGEPVSGLVSHKACLEPWANHLDACYNRSEQAKLLCHFFLAATFGPCWCTPNLACYLLSLLILT